MTNNENADIRVAVIVHSEAPNYVDETSRASLEEEYGCPQSGITTLSTSSGAEMIVTDACSLRGK